MATFTVSIPEELKKEIGKYPELHLAEYLKKKFEQKLRELKRFEELKSKGAM